MEEQGYPAAREHGRLHGELLERIAELRAVAKAGGHAAKAAEALGAAIDEHLRTEDPKLARFAAARENLRRLAEAPPGKGASLTPIPGAITPVPRTRSG
jgi:hemerythrin